MFVQNCCHLFRNKWFAPLILIFVLWITFSFGPLSDPDLGFHLKYGKWIVENHSIPVKDLSTYTVSQHEYIDIHWLFQVLLYLCYHLTGYAGISLMVCILSVILFFLLLKRNINQGISTSLSCLMLLIAILIIEPTIGPHPELITFLFITLVLILMDQYYDHGGKQIYLLPIIMLPWCNMHGLFPLGFVIMGAYFISIWFRDKKADRQFLTAFLISVLICLINPYFLRGFLFPLELLTRFDSGNIYHQRILEFRPFFDQNSFSLRDILLVLLGSITFLTSLLSFRKRKLHEFFLIIFFAVLAVISIRNVPLFVLVAIPVCGVAVKDTIPLFRKTIGLNRIIKIPEILVFILLLIIPAGVTLLLLTNHYCRSDHSFSKNRMAFNQDQQSEKAATFLLNNHLEGRILNSIGFGGWLSWRIPQPVFIDGRLEVMQEAIYEEVIASWEEGGLARLINNYQPQLIVYNYLKYYPWTFQLGIMPEWKLIYLDGFAAVFAAPGYAGAIPTFLLTDLPNMDEETPSAGLTSWIENVIKGIDDEKLNRIRMALFSRQMNHFSDVQSRRKAIDYFNLGNQCYQRGQIREALVDYDSAIILDPSYFKAYNNRGILKAFELHDYQSAIIDFNRAIEINPEYGDAYLGRGTVKFSLNDASGACRDWKTASSLGNDKARQLISTHCKK